MQRDADRPPPLFGNYEIQALIGKGGMSEVYRAKVAKGPRAGQTVALKRLLPELAKDPQYVDLFTGEADLSRLLKHPNIVEVYDVGVIGEVYFMAMEYIDGRDLSQILNRCRDKKILLPVDFAVFLAKCLLEALDHAHNARSPNGKPLNLVHCDVSPPNLFISRVGEIRLGDFGIAKARIHGTGDEELVWGKAYYLSPEQIAGHVAPSADLWSSAVVLYEMLTNEKPFTGKAPEEVAEAIKQDTPIAPREMRPEVSEALSAVVMRALGKEEGERFASARELAEALDSLYDPLIGTPMAIAALVRGLFGA